MATERNGNLATGYFIELITRYSKQTFPFGRKSLIILLEKFLGKNLTLVKEEKKTCMFQSDVTVIISDSSKYKLYSFIKFTEYFTCSVKAHPVGECNFQF